MKSLSLILRIVAILAAVGAAALFFISQGKLAEKQASLEEAQSVTQSTRAELQAANEEIASLESNLETERQALAENKRQLETVRSETYTAQQESTRTQQRLTQAQDQIEALEATAERLRSELVTAEEELANASREGEIAQLNERIDELEAANEELQQELVTAESQATQAPENTANAGNTGPQRGSMTAAEYQRSRQAAAGPAVQRASIGSETTIASISPSSGILILDSRPDLNLTPGSQVTLVRDLRALGTVEITRVSEGYAVANILPGTQTNALTPGSSVRLLR